jgi:acetyl-CoA C-acetyltransferase
MPDAVLLSACRTAIGTARKGSLRDVSAFDLAEVVVREAAQRVAQNRSRAGQPFGSGCSLGHPTAATGARIVTTLAHELHRRGGGTAVAAMCAGGGMGSALVLTA